MSENNDWEWDRERIGVIALIIIIVVGLSALVVMSMPESGDRNVSYTITTSEDTDRIDLVYRTFFGHSLYMENITLVTVKLQIADVPDVSQVVISVHTILPTHLEAIVVSNFPDESSVLHGQNQILAEQANYVVTLNAGQRNLIVYMLFENAGSFEFKVNLF
jgi:hypothetical protein